MPDAVGRLLADCEVSDGTAARDRTIEEAMRRLDRGAQSRPRARRRLAVAACGLIALVGFGFTPPGSALAEDIARLVGIGDEPSDPFQGTFMDKLSVDGRVFALGETPSGIPFEFAEERSTIDGLGGRSKQTWSCVYVSYPDAGLKPSQASCLTNAALRGFERGIVMSPVASVAKGLGEDSGFLVSLTGISDIQRVEVTYPLHGEVLTTEATVAPFSAASAQEGKKSQSRGETPLVMAAAFLPTTPFRELPPPRPASDRRERLLIYNIDSLKLDPVATKELLSQIEVTAYDEQGEVLASQDLDRGPWSFIPISTRIQPGG